jgi:hypothetical protein
VPSGVGSVLTQSADSGSGSSLEPDSFWKPASLADVGLMVKESYDDSVLMSGVNQSYVPSGTTTLKDQPSFVTAVSPKVGVNLDRFSRVA